MDRRNFLKKSALSCAVIAACGNALADGRAPRVLVVSGWQSVNIGDIAHTVGLIETLKKNIPNVEIVLWKVRPDEVVEKMLSSHFPDVEIITTQIKGRLSLSDDKILDAIKRCDILIHASGPSVVAQRHIQVWRKKCAKPYGIFGVTIDKFTPALDDILTNAAFVFTRETESLKNLKERGLKIRIAEFVPDATFAFNMKDESKAKIIFDKSSGKLTEKNFVCFIPRLRYTPYWESGKTPLSKEEVARRKAVNAHFEPIDTAKMLSAIKWVCRNTKLNILICPEMTYQVELCRSALYEPLKKDYADRLVLQGYWMPDEAAAVYARAAALVSFECHSPILALRCGTPAFYLRQPEDTIKGQMYYDLSFDNWVFEIDKTDSSQIQKELGRVLTDSSYAKTYLENAMAKADSLLRRGSQLALAASAVRG